MKPVNTLMLSFSLLAFAGAVHADDAQKQDRDTRAKPSMSQSQSSQQSSPQSSGSAAAGASADKQDKASGSAAAGASGGKQQAAGAMSAKRLMDMKVVDSQGKDLGEIDEVVLDLHNARVHAAVLASGGFLGLGEKHYAFPISEFKPGKERNTLTLNVDKQKLEDAQGFAKSKWPAMDDEYWGRMGSRGKAAAGATQKGQKLNLVRASEIIGQEVQDKSGQELGEVSDIRLNASSGRIQHIVLDVKDAGQARVQPKSLSMGTGDKLVLDMSAEQLRSQAKPQDRSSTQRERRSSTDRERQSSAGGSAASAGAGVSAAQKKTFSELDRDNDGSISRMEAAADENARSNFDEMDKNDDAKLSRDEWQTGQGAVAGGTAGKQDSKEEKRPAQSK